MKICFVSYFTYSLFNPNSRASVGGAEVQIFNLATYLHGIGHEVSIVVGDFGQSEEEVFDGIRLLKAFALGAKGMAGKLTSKLRLFAALSSADADIYVASGASSDAALISLYCRLRGRKFVFRTAHEFDCNGRNESSGLAGRLYRFGLRGADAVVTQHYGHRELLRARGVRSEVIRNAFPITEPAGGDRAIDAFWIGRCEPWKNPEMFLDLAETCPNRFFVMICPPELHQPALFDRVEARAATLPNLRFIERIPFRESQAYFDAARVFVGTSDFEGFPNTYLQACLSGTPILSYKVDPDGFIENRGAGYVAGGDYDAMVQGLHRLLDDREEWKERSAKAWQYVRETHDIRTQGALWAGLFERLLGKPRRPGNRPGSEG